MSTDLEGRFGGPRIETVWARKDNPEEPLLRDVRHPYRGGEPRADQLPCEHYFAEGDTW